MTYLGIVFFMVFGGNVLVRYGAGVCPGSFDRRFGQGWAGFLTLAILGTIAAVMHSAVTRNVLAPLGLEALEPLAYVLLVASLGYAIATALTTGTHPLLIKAGKHARDQILSCVLCAVALSAARSDFSVLEASAAGLSGALGWWCAAILLDRIVERLETEDVPPALAGVPLRLISAGLLAMAFSGVDRILVSRLVG